MTTERGPEAVKGPIVSGIASTGQKISGQIRVNIVQFKCDGRTVDCTGHTDHGGNAPGHLREIDNTMKDVHRALGMTDEYQLFIFVKIQIFDPVGNIYRIRIAAGTSADNHRLYF
jgi:hypothetical protein